MAVSTAHAREPVMQSIPSWTNAWADALRQALRMTNESCAAHLGLSVRAAGYWRERPNSIPQQRTQEILDAALARASDQAKERFALLLADGPNSGQQPTRCDIAQDGAGPATESGQVVSLIDELIGAPKAT